MANVKTKQLGNTGVNYAGVTDRLKQFREDNQHALVETKPTFNEDGSVYFSARIVSDKTQEGSPEATGTAFYSKSELTKVKSFEKLETISVGRALALLGYLNSGEIATNEEMEEFNAYKAQKQEEAIALLNDADNIDDLKTVFLSLGTLMADPKVVTAKDLKKLELSKEKK